MTTVEQLKSEISDQYMQKFKEQLGSVKSLVLLPIQEEVKKILTGQLDLPQKFDEVKEFGRWKNIINFVTPNIANQIFDFMKEKRLQIETRKTEEELARLKEEILTGKSSETPPESAPEDNSDQESSNTTPESPSEDPAPSEQSDESKPQTQTEETEQKSDSDQESPQTSDSHSAIAIGAASSGGGIAGVKLASKVSSALESRALNKKLTPEQMKTSLESTVDTLKKQVEILKDKEKALEFRMSKKQVANLDKYIQRLSAGLADVDQQTPELLKLRNSFGDKIPQKVLVQTGLDRKTLSKIAKLSDQLAGKNADEIKQILKANNIDNVGDDLVETFVKAGSKSELKGMCQLLQHGSKINRVVQTLSGMMLVDVAFLGLDVWTYIETNKEAELIKKVNELRAENKRSQANWQLGIGVASVALELLIACTVAGSMGGPMGTAVGLGIGAISAAASIGVDTLYFDVKDFYLQNKEDFIRQKKSQLNQSILQLLYNQKKGDTTLNEVLASPEPAQKTQTFQDAVWAMLFVDELENGSFIGNQLLFSYLQSGEKKADFVKNLSSEEKTQFETDRKQIQSVIQQRIAYLSPFFNGDDLLTHLENAGGIRYLNSLIDQSRLYKTLVDQKKRDEKSDFSHNLSQYKKEFFSEFSAQKLAKLENLQTTNPDLYQELMVTADLSSLLTEDEQNPSFTENVKLVDKMQEWIRLTQGSQLFQLQIPDSNKNVRFIENLLYADFDLAKTEYPSVTSDGLKNIVQQREERRGNLNVSSDPLQNVLYKLATELYGYTGANTQEELMSFYTEGLGNTHGIYFSNMRKLNKDRLIDAEISSKLPNDFPQAELDTKVDEFMNAELKTSSSSIDTPTEAIDEHLQTEFEEQLRKNLKEELKYRTLEYKKELKSQISAFVSKNAQNGNFVELPYYLLVQAQRAGFGDLKRQFFTRKNGKLEKIVLKSELNNTDHLNAKTNYLSQQREKFSVQEQQMIARVEKAHQNLEDLRSVESSFSHADELDLPKDIEVQISDKYKEREQFKADVLYYDANVFGSTELLEKYAEFARYFENLYLGILLSLTTFSMSNDIDSFALYGKALQYGNGDFFNEKGEIAPSKAESLKFLKNEAVQKCYAEARKNQKIGSKTIEELWSSEDNMEKQLGHQASKLILSTILSESLLGKNSQGKPEKIKIGGNRLDSDATSALANPDLISEKITEKLKSLYYVPAFDQSQIQNLLQGTVETKTPLAPQKQILEQTNPLQKKIEATQDDIVRQGKRGAITYDPDTSTLKSRGTEIKLAEKGGKYHLQGLNLALDLKDALWLANFANWAKYTYPQRTFAFEIEGIEDAIVVKGTLDDTKVISQDSLTEFCSIGKDETKIKQVVNWLTELVK